MKKNKNPPWFLKTSKERVKRNEELALVQSIVNAISARRHRDLLDILSIIEKTSGWHTAIQYLIKSYGKTYSSNMGIEGPEVHLEPLKYREVIFNLFHCEGLEPVVVETKTLLKELSQEKSLVDAMYTFTQNVEELTWNQISKGDSLFFGIPYDNEWISKDYENYILDSQEQEINNLILFKKRNKINVEPLWFLELGRRALSSIGIQGLYISPEKLKKVLTVIQVSPKLHPKILDSIESKAEQYEIIQPSNQEYKFLLESIIEKDSNNLRLLGSKHSIPVLNCLLYDSLKEYEVNTSSHNYQSLLTNIIYHVSIRTLDSISVLEQLCQLEDKRIVTVSITALGNFFHESAALSLIYLICNKRNKQLVEKALTALENLCKNSPESIAIIEKTLQSNCTNYNKLKRLYHKISKK